MKSERALERRQVRAVPDDLALQVSIGFDCASGRPDRKGRAQLAIDGQPVELGRRIERIDYSDARSVAQLGLHVLNLIENQMAGAQLERGQFAFGLDDQVMPVRVVDAVAY